MVRITKLSHSSDTVPPAMKWASILTTRAVLATLEPHMVPLRLSSPIGTVNWKEVYIAHHTLKVYTWGRNTLGRLGMM